MTKRISELPKINQQQKKRDRIIYLRCMGKKNKEIASLLGVSAQYASVIWHRYRKDYRNAVPLKVRGRRLGEKRILSEEQEQRIKCLIIDKTPDQLQVSAALWTRQVVQAIILRDYLIAMKIRTVGNYFKRWGIISQKLIKETKKRNTSAINQWLSTEYTNIVRRAKKEKAEIYWCNQTEIQSEIDLVHEQFLRQRSTISLTNDNDIHLRMISAINNEGKIRFKIYKQSISSSNLITFMRRLAKDAGRKIFIILHNLKAYINEDVARWLKNKKNIIEIFFIPSFTSGSNSDLFVR